MRKILLALQYWSGDRKDARRLARFIADLQPGHSDEADFIFVRRFDCRESDQDVVSHVARKFNTHLLQCKRREIGWPDGCNGLWFGLMEEVYHRIDSGMFPAYKAVLSFEADCCPLTSDWIKRLSLRWDALRDRVCIAGDVVVSENVKEHINGNCLVSTEPKFLRWVAKELAGAPPRAGWDYYFAPEFKKRGWADIPEIVSAWRSVGYTEQRYKRLVDDGVVLLHGVKDASLLEIARKKLL